MVIIFLMAYIELYLWSGCSKFQAKHTPIINNSISRAPTEQETKKKKTNTPNCEIYLGPQKVHATFKWIWAVNLGKYMILFAIQQMNNGNRSQGSMDA